MLPYSADCYDYASTQCSKGTRESPGFSEPVRSGGNPGGDGLPSQAKCAIGQFAIAFVRTTTVGVTRLVGPDFMIEIEAVAVVSS